MARLLSITRSTPLDTKLRKRDLTAPLKLGPLSLGVLTVGLVGFLTLFYIIETSMTSSEGFKIHTYEQQVNDLQDKNQQLEVEASKLRALDHLEEKLDKSTLQFVPVTQVSTVKLPHDTVTAKR